MLRRFNGGMENKTLIPLNRVARRLSVPVGWLRDEAQAGRIPALQAGRQWLADARAVEAALLLRAQKQAGAQ